jgi:hypothetical protein
MKQIVKKKLKGMDEHLFLSFRERVKRVYGREGRSWFVSLEASPAGAVGAGGLDSRGAGETSLGSRRDGRTEHDTTGHDRG